MLDRGSIAVGKFDFEFRHVFLDHKYAQLARDVQKADDAVEYARSTLRFHCALQLAPLKKNADWEEGFNRKDLECPLIAFYRDRPRLLAFLYLLRYVDCLVRHARPKLPVCSELAIQFVENEHVSLLQYFVARFLKNFDLDSSEARHAFVFMSKYHGRAPNRRKVVGAPSPLVIADFGRQDNKVWDGLEGAYIYYDAIVAYVYYMQRTYVCREVYDRVVKDAWDLALSASMRGGTENFQTIESHFNEWAMSNDYQGACGFKYTRFGLKLLHNLIVEKCLPTTNRYAALPISFGFLKQEERKLVREEPNIIPYFEKDSDYARYMLKKHKKGE